MRPAGGVLYAPMHAIGGQRERPKPDELAMPSPRPACATFVGAPPAAGARAQQPSALDRRLARSVRRRNETGLPDALKRGVEQLSGMAMDDVRVHYRSPEPARLGAEAYARGTDIYVAPGEERHLPHEAWHVAQQLAGRVRPTLRLGGVPASEDAALEREADELGERAARGGSPPAALRRAQTPAAPVVQPTRTVWRLLTHHDAPEIRRRVTAVPQLHRGPLVEQIVAYFAGLRARDVRAIPNAKVRAITTILPAQARDAILARADVDPGHEQLTEFAERWSYRISPEPFVHPLFGHPTITLYPIEKTEEQRRLARESGMGSVVHRPILDVELVAGNYYARCYLGLFATATGPQHKDVTASPLGTITVNTDLMNIGNPFKALLWCEDYLVSSEHGGGAKPVVRSYLVPLSTVTAVFEGKNGAAPVDQYRGSGQFKSTGASAYEGTMNPLAGSLVSFFYDPAQVAPPVPGQTKRPLSDLQSFVTGVSGVHAPQELATKGISGQHGRRGMTAEWTEAYVDPMEAYYLSVGRDRAWQVRDIREQLRTATGQTKGKLTLRLRALERELGLAKDAEPPESIELGYTDPINKDITYTAHR